MAVKQLFFITGFPRSGTTLVERILANQEGFFVAHQLFPTLFINVKKEFLRRNKIFRPYPFIPNSSEAEQHTFFEFLRDTKFSVNQVTSWMQEGLDYEAMGEKQILRNLPSVEGSLIEVIQNLLGNLASESDAFLGFKDVMMDDFIPYFESEGVKSIVLVRDPRAMICSLIHSQEMGAYRPTLYNLQLWKRGLRVAQKSKAYLLKYESLVQDFDAEIQLIGEYLGVKLNPDVFPLKMNNGDVWLSNSSFKEANELSNKSLDSFKEKLPLDAKSYIESICFEEMKGLNYDVAINERVELELLKEPFSVSHRLFIEWDNEKELRIELSK